MKGSPKCVHSLMDPRPYVTMAWCVQDPMYPWPDGSKALCDHGLMCPRPSVTMA